MAVGITNSVINNSALPSGIPSGVSLGTQGSKSTFTSKTAKNMFDAYYGKNNAIASNPYTQIKREAAFLKVVAEDIMSFSKSSFRKRTIVSDNTDVVQIKSKAKTPNGFKAEITVQQIATPQRNTGTPFRTNSPFDGSYGTNHFTISTGGKSFNLSVEVESTDSAKGVMEKMVGVINETDVGVFAEVKYDTSSKQSLVTITSLKTGDLNAFEISDVVGFGSIVSDLNLANTTGDSQNAVYSLNGGSSIVSTSNEVNISYGVKAVFRNASNNPVKISTGADVDLVKAQINRFAKNFNDLLKAAFANKGDRIADSLSLKLRSAVNTYSQTLSRTGLDVQADGSLKINDEELQGAIVSGVAERTFQPFGGIVNGGIGSRISKIAGEAYKEANKAGAGSMSEFKRVNPNEMLNNYFNFINQQNMVANNNIVFNNGTNGSGSLFDIVL
ncbi:MAG: hypothetical protein FWE29_05300 [Defluviitaleaceae bacterium]|nr:hypothetical protein [Defluviitaleaceae bacterium]